jgi:3-deoxy-D-manno-octulosonate 8-phosphate phosphatase KdsC-like HAD superfamily phosphatase
VADAMPEVRGVARLVTSRPGGDGAVREVADWLIAARGGAATSAPSASAGGGGIVK